MDLSKIIAVSGKPGLFSLVSQTKSGMLVESLLDGTKIPVFATDRVSALADISIYTTGEDMPLKDVLVTIFKNLNGEKAIDAKADKKEIIAFMEGLSRMGPRTCVSKRSKETFYVVQHSGRAQPHRRQTR